MILIKFFKRKIYLNFKRTMDYDNPYKTSVLEGLQKEAGEILDFRYIYIYI